MVGTRDRWITQMGRLIFPGLWRWQFWSSWNRYRRSGQFQTVIPGHHSHVGKSDYFSFAEAGDGRTYQQLSVEAICSKMLTF